MIRLPAAAALLLLLSPSAGAQAQSSAASAAAAASNAPVTLPALTAIPIPLQSISGRWNSLNPPNQIRCPTYSKVIGRVVSPRLILVKQMDCGQGIETADVLVNVELSNPADAAQMVTGRRVVVQAIFRSAHERRPVSDNAFYLMAEKAELVAGDPRAAPVPGFMSYMMCQPPELDALASKLGSELCVQSTLVANLAATGPALETAARAPADVSPTDAVSGDPDAISCRLDPGISGLHLQAVACARGSYWAWYRAMLHLPFSPTLAPP